MKALRSLISFLKFIRYYQFFSYFQIIPSLYIGNVNDLKDQLELYNITHVISVHDSNRKNQTVTKFHFKFSFYHLNFD